MKLKKVITIIIAVFFIFNTMCFAEINTGTFKPSELQEEDYGKAFEMSGKIVSTLTTVGVVIAVTGIMLMGIKYMIGTVEEKAEYKKTMIPYLIGCIFIFCISTIVSIAYSLFSKL